MAVVIKDPSPTQVPERVDVKVGDVAIRIKLFDGSMYQAAPGEVVRGVAVDQARKIQVAGRGWVAKNIQEPAAAAPTDDPAPAPKRGRGRPPKTEPPAAE